MVCAPRSGLRHRHPQDHPAGAAAALRHGADRGPVQVHLHGSAAVHRHGPEETGGGAGTSQGFFVFFWSFLFKICFVCNLSFFVIIFQRNKLKEREYSNVRYPQMTNSRSKTNMTSSRSSSVWVTQPRWRLLHRRAARKFFSLSFFFLGCMVAAEWQTTTRRACTRTSTSGALRRRSAATPGGRARPPTFASLRPPPCKCLFIAASSSPPPPASTGCNNGCVLHDGLSQNNCDVSENSDYNCNLQVFRST